MRGIRTSGLMSGDGKRSVAAWPKPPRPSSTLRWRSLALTISAALINVRPLLSRACLRTTLWDLKPRWLSSDEGVHHVRSAYSRFMGRETVFVSDPDLVRQVLVDQADVFVKAETLRRALQPVLGDAILTADGARWRWQPKAAAPIFRPDQIRHAGCPTRAEAGSSGPATTFV